MPRPHRTATRARRLAVPLLIGLAAALPARAMDCSIYDSSSSFLDALAVCTSSSLPPVGKFSYGSEHLLDFDDDTAWCEGAEGDGIGESIYVFLENAVPFDEIGITNGYAKSARSWSENSRIRKLRVTTGLEAPYEVELEDTDEPQVIRLPLRFSWDEVMLTILSVYPGTKYHDTCVTQVLPYY